jgi:3-oxoadipyl-CoA thiolase
LPDAFVCEAVRTPIGRLGGALASIRADDLAAVPIRELMRLTPGLDWSVLDDVVLGCANQAGEDNRNVARMAGLLAGVPVEVPGVTVNRLCGSGLEAVTVAARMIRTGEASVVVAGGVESMTRAPYVLSKPNRAWSRAQELVDTTLGWRFVNPDLRRRFGADSMGETAENVAARSGISRVDQDAFALRSQNRALAAQAAGRLAEEIVAVATSMPGGASCVVSDDESPRRTSLEELGALAPAFREAGSVTAGNASSLNDGACALIVASEAAARRFGLHARARIVGTAAAGVEPRFMGLGPVPATRKLLARLGVALQSIDIVELNEAFAAQALAVLRELGLEDDAPNVNPNGGAIALGHPLGMSGARLVSTATRELERTASRRALCTLCIGVGQGLALLLERP